MQLATLLLVAAIGAVGVGVVGEKVTLLGKPSLFGSIGMDVDVCRPLALDAGPLVATTSPSSAATVIKVSPSSAATRAMHSPSPSIPGIVSWP